MSKAQKKRANPFFRLLVVGFTCYAVFAMVGLQVEIAKRQREIKELEDKCTQQEIDNKEIERLLAEGNNEDYIERVARDKLDFSYPNERILVDVSGG
ncbi:FtsB family cell division protein [Merdimmobilis hominis]|uniref:FtsB family cell division protein n=1 Tax=Merdimmobilis hominis TaxID=2897707 RepID=UPI0006C82347|nr:septum formation initiator family protein [Merdimmobilis hominis]